MLHKMFTLAGRRNQYVMIDPEHPLHGRVFYGVSYARPDREPCLTEAKVLVPTCEAVPPEVIDKAMTNPELDQAGTDCMCPCQTCFEARTNYPH